MLQRVPSFVYHSLPQMLFQYGHKDDSNHNGGDDDKRQRPFVVQETRSNEICHVTQQSNNCQHLKNMATDGVLVS